MCRVGEYVAPANKDDQELMSFPSPVCLLPLVAALISGCVHHDTSDGPFDSRRFGEWDDDDDEDMPMARIRARAAFSCDFGLDPAIDPGSIPPMIERDRMHMADQPGLINKHLPLSLDFETGEQWSGGRYLFRSISEAQAYKQWVTEDYALGGIQFLANPTFIEPDCRVWRTVAAFEFGDIETDHIVMRTERWHIDGEEVRLRRKLRRLARGLRADAQEAGLTGVWLLYNRPEQLVEVVMIGDRVGEPGPAPDVESLMALGSVTTLGDRVSALGWSKVFDRTSFVLSIWHPFEPGDAGEPSIWPNSPPLPEPYCSDGVCEPSRGEDAMSCASDCTAQCGDAVCDVAEDEFSCPSDCRVR